MMIPGAFTNKERRMFLSCTSKTETMWQPHVFLILKKEINLLLEGFLPRMRCALGSCHVSFSLHCGLSTGFVDFIEALKCACMHAL